MYPTAHLHTMTPQAYESITTDEDRPVRLR